MQYRINPLLEALTYLNRRANGSTAAEFAAELAERSPEHRTRIETAAAPVINLQKKLDLLPADEGLLKLFFGEFKTETAAAYPAPGFGCNAAAFFFTECLYWNYSSFDALAARCAARTDEERITAFLTALLDSCEMLPDECEKGFARFFDALGKKNFSANDKLTVIDMLTHYSKRFESLCTLLRPFIDAIAEASDIYLPTIHEFNSLYPCPDDAAAHFEELLNTKLPRGGALTIRPYLFGFDKYICAFSDPEKSADFTANLYIGALYEDLRRVNTLAVSPRSVAHLAKAISDPSRLELLCAIRTKAAYGQELAERTELFPTTVSHHMAKLLDAGFVESVPEQGKNFYVLNKNGVRRFLKSVEQLLLEEEKRGNL